MNLPRVRIPPDWRARIVDRAPIPLLTNAHEFGLAVALGVVALPLLGGAAAPESIHSQVPGWLAAAWAWTLLVSAILTIWGLFASRPRMEWAGQLFMGHGLSFYALAILAAAGSRGTLAAVIFGFLGVVSWWRSFKITSAPQVQHRLIREARSAHEQAHIERSITRRKREGRS